MLLPIPVFHLRPPLSGQDTMLKNFLLIVHIDLKTMTTKVAKMKSRERMSSSSQMQGLSE